MFAAPVGLGEYSTTERISLVHFGWMQCAVKYEFEYTVYRELHLKLCTFVSSAVAIEAAPAMPHSHGLTQYNQ